MLVTKRDGTIVEFDRERIVWAVQKAFSAADVDFGTVNFEGLIEEIVRETQTRYAESRPGVEKIQDIVEKGLVKAGLYEVAKSYILYREKRKEERDSRKREAAARAASGLLTVRKRGGENTRFDGGKVLAAIRRAASGFEGTVSIDLLYDEVVGNVYDGIPTGDIERAMVLAGVSFIERDPAYNSVAARLLLQKVYKEAFGVSVDGGTLAGHYRASFVQGIRDGVADGQFDPRLLEFDLDRLSGGLEIGRDGSLGYLGVHTLYERYSVRIGGRAIEPPQAFWMRVAMGLSLGEQERERRSLEFYDLLSGLRFVSSTPTLFHAGLVHPQLSSCYLSTVQDDLRHIFKVFADNAQLSKWSGGIGNDWSNVRGTGSAIRSTHVESQGVIPFLKIANDVTVAINRSGKRRGATCAYLETWHLDIEDFLDLRRNTGDDRRRTHDMNTANWIPDLFMKRVEADLGVDPFFAR